MTRDDAVKVLLDNFGAPMGTRLREAQDMAIAALRAPAVTGEAAQHAETLREIADGRVVKVKDMKAACLAGADALAAPPAAGAPPALVALEQHARMMQDVGGTWHRAVPWEFVERAAWSPAPAPVAPPADEHVVGYTPDGTPLMRVVNVNAAGNFDVGVYAMPQLKREPAPPAVQVGEPMPELQVGDNVAMRETVTFRREDAAVNWRPAYPLSVERNGVVIWRRRQEGQ